MSVKVIGTVPPINTKGDLLTFSTIFERLGVGSDGQVLTANSSAPTGLSWASTGGVTSVAGTAGRITSTGGSTPVIDIDAAYVGQSSIVTLGTVSTGVWAATAVAANHGGTGQTVYAVGDVLYASSTSALSKLSVGSNGQVLTLAAGVPSWATPTTGTVTSVDVSGGTTGLTFSGGPVTSSGTITMAGTLAIGNGGSGQTTANAALNAFLPTQSGAAGKMLASNGTNSSWGVPASSGTDTAGNPGIVNGGAQTGAGVPGVFKIQGGAISASSGSSAATLVDRETVGASKVLTNNTVTSLVNCTLASNTAVAGIVDYSIEVFDGTDIQVEQGSVSYICTNKGGSFADNSALSLGNQQSVSAGTLVSAFSITAANPAVFKVNANSSLTPSSGYPRITYSVRNLTQQAVAIQ